MKVSWDSRMKRERERGVGHKEEMMIVLIQPPSYLSEDDHLMEIQSSNITNATSFDDSL